MIDETQPSAWFRLPTAGGVRVLRPYGETLHITHTPTRPLGRVATMLIAARAFTAPPVTTAPRPRSTFGFRECTEAEDAIGERLAQEALDARGDDMTIVRARFELFMAHARRGPIGGAP